MIFGNELFGGLKLIKHEIYADNRGYFTETFNQNKFLKELGHYPIFVQDNESCSKSLVIRGLHYQKDEFAQAKLVRVVKGAVIDFVLDIRKDSKTYGKMLYVYLTSGLQFYIPRGFAHGFISLLDDTIFSYKCDNFYNKEAEAGYNILDEKLEIINKLNKWCLKQTNFNLDLTKDKLIFSEKDLKQPKFYD